MAKHILVVDDDALMRRSLAFTLEQAGYRGKRRAAPRLAAPAFYRRDKCRFLAADERAGAFKDLDVEIKTGPVDALAEITFLPGLRDSDSDALHRERVFGPAVNVPA